MAARQRIPVINPGVDDVIALLLAIASPELEILAILPSYGNTDLDAARLNIMKTYQTLYDHLDRFPNDRNRFPNIDPERKPILANGPTGPLDGDIRNAQYFHGRDGLGDIASRHPEIAASHHPSDHPHFHLTDKTGVEVALNIIRSRPPRTVTYLVLGPMTNLALMLRRDYESVNERIGRVISMGGALDVPGNTSPVAEFNWFADPFAVKEVLFPNALHGGLLRNRFMMLPLDITTPHELPFPTYQKVVDRAFLNCTKPSIASEKPILTHFTSSFLEQTREIMLQFGKDAMELHDIVAVWAAISNPPFPEDQHLTFAEGWEAYARVWEIERSGELTRGMLVVDRREDEGAYPLGANRSEAQKDPHEIIEHGLPTSDAEIKKRFPLESVQGVLAIKRTPGPEKLLKILLHRVWGCTEL